VKIFHKINRLPEFEKDIKKLRKRFNTLEEDLTIFINTQLNLYHKLKIDNKGIFTITDGPSHSFKIFKAKKFACRALKGKGVRSRIRIIYAYNEAEDSVDFIEIYYKGDKTIEDKERISSYIKNKIQG